MSLNDENGNYITIDVLDKMIESGELDKYIYTDSYMDHRPFYAAIFKVITED